jgi:hypothetical protein
MVISITPHSRDNFNDLSTLTIKHSHGKIETPNRLVNRYDLNAKNEIGTDTPLTRISKSFMIQENINPEKLHNVLTKNGFLGESLAKFHPIKNRVDPDSLNLFYPSLTSESMDSLDTRKKKFDYLRFYCNVANQLGLESIVLPTIDNIIEMNAYVAKQGLQLIPVLDLREETMNFEKQLEMCRSIGNQNIPLIALKFAQYPKANKTYDLIMDNFDAIHEKHQGIMMVDTQRALYSDSNYNVSAPHYGSFLTADLVVEGYTGSGGGNTKKSVRLFCKDDLVTPTIQPSGNKFDVQTEKQVFRNDPQLEQLFEKIATNKLKEADWKNNRPKYLSHEFMKIFELVPNLKYYMITFLQILLMTILKKNTI